MKNKEKKIEEMRIQRKLEMTKDISNGIKGVLSYDVQKLAEYLISLNYVKLTEDSVVISREEYENIYEQAEQNVLANIADGGTSCHWCIEQHEKKASKETAEKFAKLIFEKFSYDKLTHEPDEDIEIYLTASELFELAKQFGVEIKE